MEVVFRFPIKFFSTHITLKIFVILNDDDKDEKVGSNCHRNILLYNHNTEKGFSCRIQNKTTQIIILNYLFIQFDHLKMIN